MNNPSQSIHSSGDNETFLSFSELASPAMLAGDANLFPVINSVLRRWPTLTTKKTPEIAPFARITKESRAGFEITIEQGKGESRKWDAVNTVCDLVSEMAWERLRSNPELLCVHGAAIQFGKRLVLFPNSRRAGKSTLASALAHSGKTVFTDDFLPIEVAEDGFLRGIANGVSPRIRKPIPDSFSHELKEWLSSDPGPENGQYKYLEDAPIANFGSALELGAIVLLNRQSTPTAPELSPIERPQALSAMITQNFSRAMYSGHILKTIGALTSHLPLYSLTYHGAEEASEYLIDHPELADLPAAQLDEAYSAKELSPEDLESHGEDELAETGDRQQCDVG